MRSYGTALGDNYPQELKKNMKKAVEVSNSNTKPINNDNDDDDYGDAVTNKSRGFDVKVPLFDGKIPADTLLTVNKIVYRKGEFVSEDDVLMELIYHSLDDIPLEIKISDDSSEDDGGAFVESFTVREGDRVKPGETIARMVYALQENGVEQEEEMNKSGAGFGGVYPLNHLRGVMNEMRSNPKKLKGFQESYARASSVAWGMIGGGVIIGLVLNWGYGKMYPLTKEDDEKRKKTAK